MRLFIAVPLPTDVSRAAARAQTALIEHGAEGRFVPRENFHITLHFIGESGALADAADAMHAAVCDIRPFVLRLGGYGAFGGRGESGRTGILQVGCDGEELKRLYESLESELWERGFSKNRSTLSPHITLGRNITGDEGFVCPDLFSAFTVNRITLFESVNERGNMRYTPLHSELLA